MPRRTPSSARSPGSARTRSGGWSSLLVAGALVILPALAVADLNLPMDGAILIALPLGLSLLGFGVHRLDKRLAESGDHRVPEATLHLIELAGGWPGALVAQRRYRHKTAKVSYQLVFWLIVAAYQFAAWESLQGWPWTHRAIGALRHALV